MKFHKKMMKAGLFAALMQALLLCACQQEEVKPVSLEELTYKSVKPIIAAVDSSMVGDISALQKRIEIRYPILEGDTLDVTILEFKSDVYALDYYMNSGRFQGSAPILRGSFLEQSIRADHRIFIFRHDSFRRYERSDLENYVRRFPGFHGGFPQAFLSLPFENREQGKTSIQTKYFMGVKSTFPVLVQSYRDGNLRWNVARSWDQEEADAFESWIQNLNIVEPKGIFPSSDCVYFAAGEGANGIATQLAGGRIAVVWGFLSWPDLERKFFTASDRIYEARY